MLHPSLQAFCAALSFRSYSTTAAKPANRCRCGTTVHAPPLSAGLLRGIVLLPPFHNGSKTRDSLPLWHRRSFSTPLYRPSGRYCPSTSFPHRQQNPRLGAVVASPFILHPSLQAFCAALSFYLLSTTAAKPTIHCRCGTTVHAPPSLQAFWAALPFYLLSATAAKPVIHCRCGTTVHAPPSLQAFWAALPFYLLSATAAKPVIHCRCGRGYDCGRDLA